VPTDTKPISHMDPFYDAYIAHSVWCSSSRLL